MTTPHEQPPEFEPVLQQKLSQDELRELLKRLEAHEMREHDMTTIGAVAEATGSDPALIERMLAEVRHQPPPLVVTPPVQEEVVRKSVDPRTVTVVIVAVVAIVLLVGLFVSAFFVVGAPTRVEVAEPERAVHSGSPAPSPPQPPTK